MLRVEETRLKMSAAVKEWPGPRSRCRCKHSGDGPDSQHEDLILGGRIIERGHGECRICRDCSQFTWVGWMPKLKERLLEIARAAEREAAAEERAGQ